MQAFDFDGALDMHRSWKMKFHLALDAIRGPEFDARPLGDEARCSLGQWLAANAGELDRYPSARDLMAIHQEFHRQAEAIATAIGSGDIVQRSDPAIVAFGALSARIEAALQQLKKDIQPVARD